MPKKKPVIVTLKESGHKSQPWTFTIDMPGNNPLTKNSERYTTKGSARRAALGLLDAHTVPSVPKQTGFPGRPWRYSGGYAWQTPKGARIEFVVVRKK